VHVDEGGPDNGRRPGGVGAAGPSPVVAVAVAVVVVVVDDDDEAAFFDVVAVGVGAPSAWADAAARHPLMRRRRAPRIRASARASPPGARGLTTWAMAARPVRW
jgi:hypothetical protein